ncbi:MAG: SDR family oxidoreductase [Williamsia sp.]|nr:SDR family oxidoreductase [Williamsia sp.]
MKKREDRPGTKYLHQKTVVITGASSGAGMAAALEFAKYRCTLVLAARRTEALDKVVAQCRDLGATAIAVKTDVTNAGEVHRLAAAAIDYSGNIDVWVNNAGVLAAGDFDSTPLEVHDQVIRTNLMGYLHGAHAVLPYFKQQRYGVLINNISVGGWMPVPYGAAYSASKFGLRGFSEALRGELSKWPGIHICELYPAFLDTPGIQHAGNFTGSVLKPAPPVYDPRKVARAMVRLAQRPRRSTTIGGVATLLRLSHFVTPTLTVAITAKVMEAYFRQAAPVSSTTGNLFYSDDAQTLVDGGWKEEFKPSRKTVAAAVLAGALATGLLIWRQTRKDSAVAQKI